MKPRQRTIFLKEGGVDYVCERCDLLDPEAISDSELEYSIMVFSKALAPVPEPMLRLELSALMTVTAGKVDDAEVKVRLYARHLQEYPADCVMSSINHAAKTAKFFPALSELLDDIEWRAKPRQYKLQALSAESVRRSNVSSATVVADHAPVAV